MATNPTGFNPADYIQIGLLVVAILAFLAVGFQSALQVQALKAQTMATWFQMYWQTLDHPTDDDVEGFCSHPGDYMAPEAYEARYKEKKNKIVRYMGAASTYEFLAMTQKMESRWFTPLPFGADWKDNWIRDLYRTAPEEFTDVHFYYARYYPDLHAHVERLLPSIRDDIERRLTKPKPSPGS